MTGLRASGGQIAIVSSYPFEDTNAAKARITSFRTALVAAGWNVSIVCRRGQSASDDPNVVDVSFPNSAPRNFLLRGLYELWFSLSLARKVKALNPELVIATVPSLFLLVMAWLRRSPIIFDVRDLVWEYLPENTWFERFSKRALEAWCMAMLRRARVITVTNVAEQSYLKSRLFEGQIVEVVANGLSRERFDQLTAGLTNKNSASRPKRLLYVGNVGLAQDLTTLLAGAEQFPEMHVTIVGTGNDLQRIRQMARELKLANVEFVGGLNWDKLIRYYDDADVLYAQIGSAYRTAVPSKLSEYMVVGRPIIFGGVGVSAEWLGEFTGVAVIPPSDATALIAALDRSDQLWGELDVTANRSQVEAKYLRDEQAKTMLALVCMQQGVDELD